MKYFLIIVIFCLPGHIAFAQNNLKAAHFIDEIITKKNTGETAFFYKVFTKSNPPPKAIIRNDLFYQDSIGKEVITKMREGLKYYTNVFHGAREDSVVYIDSVGKKSVMSADDANRLAFKNIDPLKNSSFKIKKIIADSLVITDEEKLYIYAEIEKMKQYAWGKDQFVTLKVITADIIKKEFANLKNDGWTDLNKKGVGRIYNFSIPIFLRDDTFCFFYYGYGCGWLCGEGEFAIYKKENGRWVKFATLLSWES